ncbi:hypothetical protein RM190_14550 [Paracoccus sp. CPCC 101403]|uniref:Uncharacterized protein n=1 Tax=Paracoccus broussonetiae TaxID=3075834 RepID=A0ABU3EFS0_9RHOB|nr:hypothetical protein [Paracoccus sp. CPCC 101403]MDT1063094.1 hypothetical protein [Paracoccus sp. CPCC 101403]
MTTHAEDLPVVDFPEGQGYDPDKAEVTVSIDDRYIANDQDLDGDGNPDACITSRRA